LRLIPSSQEFVPLAYAHLKKSIHLRLVKKMDTCFSTPRSSAYGDYSRDPVLTSSSSFGALASIMVPSESFPKTSLVTPDYIEQQDICYTGLHQAGTTTQKKQLSLIVSAVGALTSNDDMPLPPRREHQPPLIPRPGKNTPQRFKCSQKAFYSHSSLFLTLVYRHFDARENRSI
jgi:hypothetical protein